MSASIRELIMQNIKTTLETIKISNGYEVDVEAVFRVQHSPYDGLVSPFVVIFDTGEDKQEGTPFQFTTCTLHLDCLFWNSGLYDDVSASQEAIKLACAIEKALGVDNKRGGYAIDTDILGNSTTLDAENFPVGGGSVRVDVQYRHRVYDPYTQ